MEIFMLFIIANIGLSLFTQVELHKANIKRELAKIE